MQLNDESEIIIDTEILNKDIDQDEMKKGIKCLQNGKAAGIDLILNEFLKTSTDEVVKLIQKLFNECLKFGVYPWNTTIVTPLHKKGCPHDPDNYRLSSNRRGQQLRKVILKYFAQSTSGIQSCTLPRITEPERILQGGSNL